MTWLIDDELTLRLCDLESQWVERKRSGPQRHSQEYLCLC